MSDHYERATERRTKIEAASIQAAGSLIASGYGRQSGDLAEDVARLAKDIVQAYLK